MSLKVPVAFESGCFFNFLFLFFACYLTGTPVLCLVSSGEPVGAPEVSPDAKGH